MSLIALSSALVAMRAVPLLSALRMRVHGLGSAKLTAHMCAFGRPPQGLHKCHPRPRSLSIVAPSPPARHAFGCSALHGSVLDRLSALKSSVPIGVEAEKEERRPRGGGVRLDPPAVCVLRLRLDLGAPCGRVAMPATYGNRYPPCLACHPTVWGASSRGPLCALRCASGEPR